MMLLLPLTAGAATVMVATIHGAISPPSAAYFLRALERAQRSDASLLVLKLDTPGGLSSSMRVMIQGILASKVPVATWVAPSGARAASAGTYLLYASQVAAMAPGTNLGAATPVSIGFGGGDGKSAPEKGEGKGKGKGGKDHVQSGSTEARKAMHDAAAYIRSLAQLRGRNVAWAERAVVSAASLSAKEAYQQNVIDFIAVDLPDLLRQANGRKVKVAAGETTLALAGASVVTVPQNWKERLFTAIADPNIALILMMIGVYGLLIEFYTTSFGIAGIAGAICLLLGLYALAMLPINAVGALLLLLGVVLMAAEAFVPSFGALGIGGVVAFVIGALMLVNGDVPGLQVSLAFVMPLAATSALLLAGVGYFALRSRRRPAVSGAEGMVGATAVALDDIDTEGWVRASGERWRAHSTAPLPRGAKARIKAVHDLMLEIEPEANDGGEP
jgi:membrane-bound serine protease (ClpP class)